MSQNDPIEYETSKLIVKVEQLKITLKMSQYQSSKSIQKNNQKRRIFIINILACLIVCMCLATLIRQSTKTKQKSQLQKLLLSRQISCAKRHTIAYIWLGKDKIPAPYQAILDKCKQNVRLLTQVDLNRYVQQWNSIKQLHIKISLDNPLYKINDKADLLKLLFLFFQGGIYADFDEIINEECWEREPLSEQIIFTNYWLISHGNYVPQQSFMIAQKGNPHVFRMLISQITKVFDRWTQCYNRQCKILHCQYHTWNRLWTQVQNTTK